MSYWIHLEIDTGAGESVEAMAPLNYTSNVSPMWREALGRPLYELNGTTAADAVELLAAGIQRMQADPEKYREMEPSNGWGDYPGALAVLLTLRDFCVKHPKATIGINR